MSETNPSPIDEVRALADAQFDGQFDRAQCRRLEELILADTSCLQAYIAQLTIHEELLRQSDQRTSPEAVADVLNDFAMAVQQRQARNGIFWAGVLTTVAASLLLFVGGWFWIGRSDHEPLGIISHLSTDASATSKAVDLGQVVWLGETLNVESGVLSLQLPQAMIDLIGPTTARLDGLETLSLRSGTVVARITQEGQQFRVLTPDAEVVDLGTEFLVHYRPEKGTDVSVRQGRVRAGLLSSSGAVTQQIELTELRSAQIAKETNSVREVEFQGSAFAPVDRSRGGIRSLDGMLRTASNPPLSLRAGEVPTHNHILVIPEQLGVVLQQDLKLDTLDGPLHLPAKSVISSYLIHYDPPADLSVAPRGAVTFMDPIAGVIASTDALAATDSLFGLPGVEPDPGKFRGLELGEDEDSMLISSDRRTLSIRFDISPPWLLDEARVIVVHQE